MTYILLFAWMLTDAEPRIEVIGTFQDIKACRHMATELSHGRGRGLFSCVPAR